MAPRPRPHGSPNKPDTGVWKKGKQPNVDADIKVADFSYQNDDIAKEIIVKAWSDPVFLATLLGDQTPNHVQQPAEITARITAAVTALSALPNKPVTLKSAIVLTEAEYNEGWDVDDQDQVVFVLPRRERATGNLLETAKMLMACVPNRIEGENLTLGARLESDGNSGSHAPNSHASSQMEIPSGIQMLDAIH